MIRQSRAPGPPAPATASRRVRVGAGPAILALAAALAGCHRHAATDAAPAGAQLKVEMGKSAKLDPDSPLRCFVHGQFVGMQTPAECATKNGVAPGALDVGLDQSGAIAAGGGDTPLQPLAKATGNEADDTQVADAAAAAAPADAASHDGVAEGDSGIGQTADCLRFEPGGWRDAGRGVTLNQCVHTLFDGRCVGPGQAAFGRWGPQTLRLIPGRVGMSPNNRDFRPLAPQDPETCTIPGG